MTTKFDQLPSAEMSLSDVILVPKLLVLHSVNLEERLVLKAKTIGQSKSAAARAAITEGFPKVIKMGREQILSMTHTTAKVTDLPRVGAYLAPQADILIRAFASDLKIPIWRIYSLSIDVGLDVIPSVRSVENDYPQCRKTPSFMVGGCKAHKQAKVVAMNTEQRDQRISFRLTQNDVDALDLKVSQTPLGRSEFLRSAALGVLIHSSADWEMVDELKLLSGLMMSQYPSHSNWLDHEKRDYWQLMNRLKELACYLQDNISKG